MDESAVLQILSYTDLKTLIRCAAFVSSAWRRLTFLSLRDAAALSWSLLPHSQAHDKKEIYHWTRNNGMTDQQLEDLSPEEMEEHAYDKVYFQHLVFSREDTISDFSEEKEKKLDDGNNYVSDYVEKKMEGMYEVDLLLAEEKWKSIFSRFIAHSDQQKAFEVPGPADHLIQLLLVSSASKLVNFDYGECAGGHGFQQTDDAHVLFSVALPLSASAYLPFTCNEGDYHSKKRLLLSVEISESMAVGYCEFER